MSSPKEKASVVNVSSGDGHTPGTWAVVEAQDDCDYISVCAFDGDPRDGIMADVIAEVMSIRDEDDARLIAAAPAMLEALTDALSVLDQLLAVADISPSVPLPLVHAHADAARAAIQSATRTA